MRPAFSVLLLTTMIGAAQGLFIALFFCELLAPDLVSANFLTGGSAIIFVFCSIGLAASFFHLGHPERAWRAMMMWRTSWLSREVIALPAFMAADFCYGAAHWFNFGHTLPIGLIGVVLALALFVCTSMIYGAVKVLKEWAHPWTVINFILLGTSSGTTLAAGYANFYAHGVAAQLSYAALCLTLLSLVTRSASLLRNSNLTPASTLQSAIGVRHPHIVQKTQGGMGGSYNTREYFHGKPVEYVRRVIMIMFIGAFILPVMLVIAFPLLAFFVQYAGMLAERWYFFAEAKHPQNLYYQTVS
jgi:DMSO reductase anchor subunit